MWEYMGEQNAAGTHTRRSRYAPSKPLDLGTAPDGSPMGAACICSCPRAARRAGFCAQWIQGKRRDLGLGGVTLVSLAEAREQATRLRKIARAGGDPFDERRRERRPRPEFRDSRPTGSCLPRGGLSKRKTPQAVAFVALGNGWGVRHQARGRHHERRHPLGPESAVAREARNFPPGPPASARHLRLVQGPRATVLGTTPHRA